MLCPPVFTFTAHDVCCALKQSSGGELQRAPRLDPPATSLSCGSFDHGLADDGTGSFWQTMVQVARTTSSMAEEAPCRSAIHPPRSEIIRISQANIPAGIDLEGNTFWEVRSELSASRQRRVLKPYRSSTHLSDVAISPSWHQWLRHTRPTAPSVTEQQEDLQRMARVQYLAARADEKWASKTSMLAQPGETGVRSVGKRQALPTTAPKDPGGYASRTESEEKMGVRSAVGPPLQEEARRESIRNSGKEKDTEAARGRPKNPGDGWQPEAWNPLASSVKR